MYEDNDCCRHLAAKIGNQKSVMAIFNGLAENSIKRGGVMKRRGSAG